MQEDKLVEDFFAKCSCEQQSFLDTLDIIDMLDHFRERVRLYHGIQSLNEYLTVEDRAELGLDKPEF